MRPRSPHGTFGQVPMVSAPTVAAGLPPSNNFNNFIYLGAPMRGSGPSTLPVEGADFALEIVRVAHATLAGFGGPLRRAPRTKAPTREMLRPGRSTPDRKRQGGRTGWTRRTLKSSNSNSTRTSRSWKNGSPPGGEWRQSSRISLSLSIPSAGSGSPDSGPAAFFRFRSRPAGHAMIRNASRLLPQREPR